jgi:dolichol-phosphate mannosyltransferase
MNETMRSREKNFISAVVYLHNDGGRAVDFCKALCDQLDAHFEQYELVAVNDACADDTVPRLRKWAKGLSKPLTVLNMSLYQRREQCMNAGLDAAIGDYVYEFDSTAMPYDATLIFAAYQQAMQGSDIVSVCPEKSAGTSRLFYRIFNANSRAAYQLRTDAFRLVSRRAVNRVHASSDNQPYRKAAYAASGLKMATLTFPGSMAEKENGRFGLAADSLALYTDAGFKVSAGIAVAMMLLALAELVYTLVIFFTGKPVAGWTTMMFVLTVGFAGLFGVLTIVIKYLSLLVELVFKKQKYFVESIEKIQK